MKNDLGAKPVPNQCQTIPISNHYRLNNQTIQENLSGLRKFMLAPGPLTCYNLHILTKIIKMYIIFPTSHFYIGKTTGTLSKLFKGSHKGWRVAE